MIFEDGYRGVTFCSLSLGEITPSCNLLAAHAAGEQINGFTNLLHKVGK